METLHFKQPHPSDKDSETRRYHQTHVLIIKLGFTRAMGLQMESRLKSRVEYSAFLVGVVQPNLRIIRSVDPALGFKDWYAVRTLQMYKVELSL